MLTISVAVCGDHWLNPEYVTQELAQSNVKDPVILSINTEGPSLEALGVFEVVRRHCLERGREPGTVYLSNWCNDVEETSYKRTNRHSFSHFFWYSRRYWIDSITESTREHLFGFFVGRRTVPRTVMMYQLWNDLPGRCLFSLMINPYVNNRQAHNLEKIEDWLPASEHDAYKAWWGNPPVESLDGSSIIDQYNQDKNPHKQLLEHYPRFEIELCCESYARGASYFVTEKTVRPIVALKPALIHAPIGFLKNLHRQGFRTWNECWDESYDLLEGPARWQSIRKVMNTIASLDDTSLADILKKARAVCEHNKTTLTELIEKHGPIDD